MEGRFHHETFPIDFTLVVDDFLIKCKNKSDPQHLCQAMGKCHEFKVDEDAKQHVGTHLKWDCDQRVVTLSMDGCVKQALLELEHPPPTRPVDAPSKCAFPKHGGRVQHAKVDESSSLEPMKVTCMQRVTGKLLHCAKAVDPTMLHANNEISMSAAKLHSLSPRTHSTVQQRTPMHTSSAKLVT